MTEQGPVALIQSVDRRERIFLHQRSWLHKFRTLGDFLQRRAWFELHDHPLYPRLLRDLFTDGLEAMWDAQNTYGPAVPLLQNAMQRAGATRVVDLCSGGGGPWLGLSRILRKNGTAEICLTDLYPNRKAFERLRREAAVDFQNEPVDATCIPRELKGFRTIFTSFHHFAPDQGKAILRDAFEARQGIAVFESANLEPRTLVGVFLVPVLTLLLTPRIRPFRWSRFLFTYLLPVVPFTLWLDGILSCLRSYSQQDFQEMVSGLTAEDYRWEMGIDRSRFVAIAYLIGYPMRGAHSAEEDTKESETKVEKPALREAMRAF